MSVKSIVIFILFSVIIGGVLWFLYVVPNIKTFDNIPYKTESVTPQKPNVKITGMDVYDAYTYTSMKTAFTKYNYEVKTWTGSVPSIAPNIMPQDFKDMPVSDRKIYFIRMMIPLIVHANAYIVQDRDTVRNIAQIYGQKGVLDSAQKADLHRISKRYQANKYIEKGDIKTALATLEHRVQPIPVSLALSQAIIESGWGTSRFATQGNSLFGQWTYAKGAGLTPENRDAGKSHTVRAFNSPYDSVEAYMLNLNRNRAYAGLRKIRYELIQKQEPITGHALAEGLQAYSALGYDYVVKLQGLIINNGLEMYNQAVLR